MTSLASARRWLRSQPPLVVDSVIAVGLFLLSAVTLLISEPHAEMGEQPDTVFAYVLAAVMTLPVAARRIRPLVVYAVVLAAMTVYECLGYGGVNVSFFGPI